MHFCVVAEIAGDVAPEAYIAAFAAVQRRHPLLNVDIRAPASGRGSAAFHAVNRPIEVKIRAFSQAHDWQWEVERELTTPQPGTPGPLMRASILHQPDKVHVVLTFHHAIADGLSAAFIIRDLMAALNGCVVQPLPQSASIEDLSSALPRSADRDDLPSVPQIDPEALRAIAGQDIWQKFDEERIVVSTMALSERLTARLGETAKANGTTVHGAISAALALSLFDQGAGCTLGSPINLRPILDVEEDCGYFVILGVTCLPKHERTGFWALAQQAMDDLAQPRSPEGVAASLDFMAAHVTATTTPDIASGILGRFAADAVLSNLGRLSIPQTIGRLRLNAFWGPMGQARRKRERFIGAATVGHRLRLVQTSPHGTPSLLPAIKDHLTSAVSAAPT